MEAAVDAPGSRCVISVIQIMQRQQCFFYLYYHGKLKAIGHDLLPREVINIKRHFYFKRSKYRNNKVKIGEETYDSQKEYFRYLDLLAMEKAGEIRDLRRQVKYVLIPAQREPDTIGPRGGVHKGKLIENECYYLADFVYMDAKTGDLVVEDTKSEITKTKDYVIKRKLMLYVHGIRIKEV